LSFSFSLYLSFFLSISLILSIYLSTSPLSVSSSIHFSFLTIISCFTILLVSPSLSLFLSLARSQHFPPSPLYPPLCLHVHLSSQNTNFRIHSLSTSPSFLSTTLSLRHSLCISLILPSLSAFISTSLFACQQISPVTFG
jgi:hypothetical protein